MFLARAAFNLLVTLRNPESLRGFAELAMIDPLGTFILDCVTPYASLSVSLLSALASMVGALLPGGRRSG